MPFCLGIVGKTPVCLTDDKVIQDDTKSCSVHSFKRCVMKKAITVMRLPFNMIRN